MAKKVERTYDGARTEPEVMLASDFMESRMAPEYDGTRDGDIIIVIPDTGQSVFRPAKVKKDKSGLSTPVFEIVNVGGFGPVPLGTGKDSLNFDNGAHASQSTYYKLQVLTFPKLNQCPADIQREAFTAIIADDSYTEEVRKAAQASLDKLPAVATESAEVQPVTQPTTETATESAKPVGAKPTAK